MLARAAAPHRAADLRHAPRASRARVPREKKIIVEGVVTSVALVLPKFGLVYKISCRARHGRRALRLKLVKPEMLQSRRRRATHPRGSRRVRMRRTRAA
jgi:hypothetical protein